MKSYSSSGFSFSLNLPRLNYYLLKPPSLCYLTITFRQRWAQRRCFFNSGSGSAAAFFCLQRKAAAPLYLRPSSEQRFSASVKAINLPLPLLQKNFKEHSFKLQLRNVNNKIKLLSSILLIRNDTCCSESKTTK